MDMKQLGFLFDKLGFNAVTIGCHSWMIIVLIASWNLGGWSCEGSEQGHALGIDLEGTRIVGCWIIGSEGTSLGAGDTLEITGPLAMTVGILPAQPADKIAILEVEPEESTSIELCSVRTQFGWGILAEARTSVAQGRDGCLASHNADGYVGAPCRADFGTCMA
jgi:hypothetical protein